MSTLFVAMQDRVSRRWAPVARLSRDNGQYRFVYTQGCRELPEFEVFGRLTDLDAEYVSNELFPLFANRVLPKARPEYRRYMEWLGLSPVGADAIEELSRTGGLRATDGLEVISCPEPTADQRYEIRFFARGLGHLSLDYLEALDRLETDERLYLARDVQNHVDTMALMMRANDPGRLVGYVPGYYSADVARLLELVGPDSVEVYVDGVNRDAPLHYRLRCRLTSPWPDGFVACGAPEFQPLATQGASQRVPKTRAARPKEKAA
jgi:hypothetical protein